MNHAIALFLLPAILHGLQTAPHRSAAQMEVKRLKVNDVELAYVEEGRGDTVAFVHGAMGDWRYWESLRPLIASRYRFVSFSRRYHYPNPWPDDGGNDSMAQHVEDAAAFIRALNAGRVHLVGNSGGGIIATHVALKYPELLRSVVLGEPSLIPPVSAEGKAALETDRSDRQRVDAAIKAGDLRKAEALRYDLLVTGEAGSFERLPAEQQQQRLDNVKTLALRGRRAEAAAVTCEQLGTLRVPALVVMGGKTRAIRRYFAERLLSCLPKTTVSVVIPQAHHSWHQSNPQGSAEAILSFISRR
jgi:non-heme chloroperoxidase